MHRDFAILRFCDLARPYSSQNTVRESAMRDVSSRNEKWNAERLLCVWVGAPLLVNSRPMLVPENRERR